MSDRYPQIDGEVERGAGYDSHPEMAEAGESDNDIGEAQAVIDGVVASGIVSAGVTPVDFKVPPTVFCLDTESTGLDYDRGDRLISIGIVKIEGDKLVSEREWMINPEKAIAFEATRVHGITNKDLVGKPKFADIAKEVVDEIGNVPLVIHNSAFDMGFLQNEMALARLPPIENRVIDTLGLARRALEPGKKASLDALLKNQLKATYKREVHGALVDARLLAMVYLWFRDMALKLQANRPALSPRPGMEVRPPRLHLVSPSQSDLAAHYAVLPPTDGPGHSV